MTASSFSEPREPAGDERQLPGARHAHERDVLGLRAVADERVDGALDQAVDDEVVEAAGDDAEPRSLGYDQASFDHARRHRCPCSAPWPIEWSGTRSTTSSPKPWMPASLRGLFVRRRISCRPRSTSTCAPRPNSRSGASFEGAGTRRVAQHAPGVELAAHVASRRDVDEGAAPGRFDLRDRLAQVPAAVARRRGEEVGDGRARVHAAERRLAAGDGRP